MDRKELTDLLNNAADYFKVRGFAKWEQEARYSAGKIQNHEYGVIEKLWLKYSPTGEVDDLFITEYEPEEEKIANELNESLAEIVNALFWELDKAMRKMGDKGTFDDPGSGKSK